MIIWEKVKRLNCAIFWSAQEAGVDEIGIAPQDQEGISNAFVLLQASYRDQDILGMSADVPDLNLFPRT